jgi:hypothetical protein
MEDDKRSLFFFQLREYFLERLIFYELIVLVEIIRLA